VIAEIAKRLGKKGRNKGVRSGGKMKFNERRKVKRHGPGGKERERGQRKRTQTRSCFASRGVTQVRGAKIARGFGKKGMSKGMQSGTKRKSSKRREVKMNGPGRKERERGQRKGTRMGSCFESGGVTQVRGKWGANEIAKSIMESKKGRPMRKRASEDASGLMRECAIQYMTGMHGGSTEDEAQMETVINWISKFRAAGTTTVYARAFRRAEAFVRGLGYKALPMDAWVFGRYLTALADHCVAHKLTRGNIDLVCAAVKFFHVQAGLTSPTDTPLIRMLQQSMRKVLGKGANRKTALMSSEVALIHTRYVQQGKRMEDLWFMLRIAMMHDGLMRWDDISRVEFGDIVVLEDHARVFVCESKTDFKREGVWILLQNVDCPWGAYRLLLELADRVRKTWNSLNSKQQGQWALEKGSTVEEGVGGGLVLTLKQVPIMAKMRHFEGITLPVANDRVSYREFLTEFKGWLRAVGLPAEQYATHSMRRGGASDLREQGVREEMILLQGRWRSSLTMQAYFDWNTEFTVRSAAMAGTKEGWMNLMRQREMDGARVADSEGRLGTEREGESEGEWQQTLQREELEWEQIVT
jgi:hypothetical protein